MSGPLSRKAPRGARTVAKLRHRVRIERLDESVRDVSGAVVPSWVEVATVWASVDALPGTEQLVNGQTQANVRYAVVVRGRADLTAKNRLVWLTGPSPAMVLNVLSAPGDTGAASANELTCVREETNQ